jgi:glycosyltransferase involved in cell wall biosynthesis
MNVTIVLPAYNASKTLPKVYNDIKDYNYKIILCDDCSKDNTVEIAKTLGIETIVHTRNLGYGGNQKTLYKKVLESDSDIIVMLHPDYQYEPKVIPYMVGFIKEDICDVILGNRIRTRKEALDSGMPVWKYLINRLSSGFENFIFGQNLGEWHSGLRAYSRKVLETIPWENNSNDFVFDQQFLIQCVFFGFKIGDIPVSAKYFKDASSINFIKSFKYGVETLINIKKYFLTKYGIIKSKIFFK